MNRWFGIGLNLSLAFPFVEWREAPWLRDVITDGDVPGRVRAFELTEEPHRRHIEMTIERWLKDIASPTLEHPASYLLALRYSTVGHLLMTFEGVFPPPGKSLLPEIYRKFLLDWWRKHGAMYAVGYSCSEYDHEG